MPESSTTWPPDPAPTPSTLGHGAAATSTALAQPLDGALDRCHAPAAAAPGPAAGVRP